MSLRADARTALQNQLMTTNGVLTEFHQRAKRVFPFSDYMYKPIAVQNQVRSLAENTDTALKAMQAEIEALTQALQVKLPYTDEARYSKVDCIA